MVKILFWYRQAYQISIFSQIFRESDFSANTSVVLNVNSSLLQQYLLSKNFNLIGFFGIKLLICSLQTFLRVTSQLAFHSKSIHYYPEKFSFKTICRKQLLPDIKFYKLKETACFINFTFFVLKNRVRCFMHGD